MTLWDIVLHALLMGTLLFALVLIVLLINPEIMLNDYPPDIRDSYGPVGNKTKVAQAITGLVFIAIVVLAIAYSIKHIKVWSGGQLSFTTVYVDLFVMFSVFNLLDLIIMDWIICLVLRPRFIILPGTEGMKGYEDWWFHFRGFLIGTLIIMLLSPAAASLVLLLDR